MPPATFAIAILACILNLAAAIPLPDLKGAFTEHQIEHSNGSTVTVSLHDSYTPSRDSIDTLDKRFYKIFHNGTRPEICAETNFVATTTSDSALSDDCSAIMTELRAHPGFFETGDYAANGYNYLAVCGTCAFGVLRTDGLSSPVDIGSKDVVDNINSALIRFPINNRVGAMGNFTCNSAPISWAILRATGS
ncbi:putative necrosis-inducing factor-domain-containing protein [Hypomontagnella monticulosa]|nr:putative necrosis-inducing factor-domain-containing protein [Hypomontagnella monticulosa]